MIGEIRPFEDLLGSGQNIGPDLEAVLQACRATHGTPQAETALNMALKAVRAHLHEAEPEALEAKAKHLETLDDRTGLLTDLHDTLRSMLDRLSARPEIGPVQPDESWTRPWVIPGWLPRGRVTRLSSHGGSGKSFLALELAAAVASGLPPQDGPIAKADAQELGPAALKHTAEVHKDINAGHHFRLAHAELGHLPPSPVLYLSWEDEPQEINRRVARLPSRRIQGRPQSQHRTTQAATWSSRLLVGSMEKAGPLWAPLRGGHRDTAAGLTEAGEYIETCIRETRPALTVIDPTAAAYMGNENDRGAVRRWLSHLNALARETRTAILLVSHPPKNTEHAYSGSTDWDNGVRAAWQLAPANVPDWEYSDKGKTKPALGLALTLTKANYARAGQRIWLQWSDAQHERGLVQCTAGEAALAWHRDRGLPEPGEKAVPVYTTRSWI